MRRHPTDGGFPADSDLQQMSDDGCPLTPDPTRWDDPEWKDDAGRPPGASRAVLVVEDSPDGDSGLAAALGLCGHEARVTRPGEEAVRAMAAFTPDAVVVDVGLPGYEGYLTARRLGEVARRRPLFVAVADSSDLKTRSWAEGFDHHLVRPVDPAALTELLARHAVPALPRLRHWRTPAQQRELAVGAST